MLCFVQKVAQYGRQEVPMNGRQHGSIHQVPEALIAPFADTMETGIILRVLEISVLITRAAEVR